MSQQDRPAVCSVCSCIHATAALYVLMRVCAVGLQCSRCEIRVSMLQHISVVLNGFGTEYFRCQNRVRACSPFGPEMC